MSFLSDFINKVKVKKAEMDERKDFLATVDEQAKPFRRAAYMKEMVKQSINEGIAKAKLDAEKRLPKKKKTPQDFGIGGDKKEVTDQWAFLDNIGIVKDGDKTNLTKSNKKKK